ncbi:hypothetical protein [Clostridium folliculivorans]|uniref:Uncharacterized protein n=1 Tax=Clostridium folliculivorans TaxID=2886038 RepID=A0A9W5Y1Z2_9CLOT|nr:hypothetical protein [Clostridium folliculivorans]GKU25088.1 hypothetical protein CFOLD11_19140 [Clostridium folliculivorans]GKU31186.1 hypothetical protein CFB3_32930 [Clostridium folliculivorans]
MQLNQDISMLSETSYGDTVKNKTDFTAQLSSYSFEKTDSLKKLASATFLLA